MATGAIQKPPVPVVKHVIRDDDIGIKKGVKIQAVNYSKVIKLLTDPHSATLFERHLSSLQKLIRHYQAGFLMKDLVQVFKILNVCADRVNDHPLYTKPMLEILRIASLPFLKEKTSDGTAYSQIVVESISQLGYLMRVPSKEVRLQLASSLLSIFCNELPKHEVQDHQAASRAYNMTMVEKSDVAETLVKSLALLEQDIDVKLHILDLLQNLAAFSAPNCDKMLAADAASRICSRMNDPEPSGRLLFRSIEILWNLLENGDKNEVARQLSSFVCVKALQDAFSQQMTNGFSHFDRQLRNDLLVITTLVATVCDQAPFIFTQEEEITFEEQTCTKHFNYKLGESTLQETDSHPYLGVTITQNLNWNTHIDRITASANRTLGFIQRNLYPCPQHTKETAFKTLVRPLIEYSSAVWDPYTKVLTNKLEMVQRRAARFCLNDFKTKSKGCVTDMLSKLDWAPLSTRRQNRRLVVLHKAIHGHLSLPIGNLLQPHQRSSRHYNSQAFITISASKDCYKNSFVPRTIKDWNTLPENIVNITEPNLFKQALETKQSKQSTTT